MQINMLCKQLALRDLFEEFDVSPGSGLLYYELQRLWDKTGLRRNDLEDALAQAFFLGELAELYSHEGRLAVLTERGYVHTHSSPETLRQIEAYARALGALDWARARLRRGAQLGRRNDDPMSPQAPSKAKLRPRH